MRQQDGSARLPCSVQVEHLSEPEAAAKIAAADNQTAAANATNATTAAAPAVKAEAKDAKETPAELKVDVAYLAKVRRVAWSERWVRLHL